MVTVLPVNDPPSLSEIIIPNILEDNPSSISFEIFDPDNNEFSVSAADMDNISITLEDSFITNTGVVQWITISSDSNWYGSRNTIVSVSDGEYLDSQQIIINVESVNDSPIINDIPNQSVNEDQSIDIFINGQDIDGDQIIYSVNESEN